MRREEAILRLIHEGWSAEAARERVLRGGGLVAAWEEDTWGRVTARVAKGGRLSNRKSGRRRKREPRRWRWSEV